ncbi:phage tail tape measure protein [Paenibacillus lautus]|uniref:phage tail tape measure protein n=1 Tax=Paenibacillus lautus TaxID=1401 RepID=UPI001C7DDC52|nr:phage tail tape measure protein [Paenibacillus lautus]MBX4147500.1 phage tail tape measure protein [Paenibacillus lautus]
MSDKLAILISAELNQGLALRDINTAIKALGKSKHLQKLNLKIDVDDSFVKSINKFIESTGKLNVALASQNKVVQETITEHRKLDGSIQKTTEQILKNGEIINRTKVVHDANKKAIQAESQGYESQIKTLQQLEKELVGYTLAKSKANKNAHGQVSSHSNTYQNELGQKINVRTDPTGKVKNYDEITDYLKRQQDALAQEQAINKQREQIAKEEYNTRKALQDKTEKEQAAHYKQLEALDKAHYQALKTDKERKDALEKTHYLALQQNAKREQQYLKNLADTETKIADIKRRFGKDSDVSSGLVGIESQLGQLKKDGSVGDFKSRFDQLNTQLKQVAANAKTATSHTVGFGEALKTAMSRFPVWMVAATAIYAPLRALQNGIQYIYDLDTEMTNLQKVTENTADEYRQFIQDARGIGDAIGGLTLDVVKSTTEWARLGYTIQEAKALAKETLVYQNVGDIESAEKASQALIATIKGFGVEVDLQGKNIAKVVDIYNEVGNKFAISSQGIGEAMRRSAASLSGAGNTIEQSVAMITAANTTIQDPARVGNALI